MFKQNKGHKKEDVPCRSFRCQTSQVLLIFHITAIENFKLMIHPTQKHPTGFLSSQFRKPVDFSSIPATVGAPLVEVNIQAVQRYRHQSSKTSEKKKQTKTAWVAKMVPLSPPKTNSSHLKSGGFFR